MSNDYVGVDEILGADELDEVLSGDVVGIDEILGAVTAKNQNVMKRLAAARAAGQKLAINKQDDSSLKWELLPIPLTSLLAGESRTITVRPTRSQRLDQIEFPSSNADHQFVALTSITIMGVEQLNGPGGVLLSQLSEMRANNILRGSTAQRADDIQLTFQNLDAVNARTLRGTIGGPTLRAVG